MGVPIRLAIGSTGSDNITLDAVSMDISVDRNVSAFPTPNNILHRMAIDTNIPSVEIEIQGILQDDDMVPEVTSSTSSRSGTIINFASTIPTTVTTKNLYDGAHCFTAGFVSDSTVHFYVKAGQGFGTSISAVGPIDVFDRYVYGESESAIFDSMVGNKLFDKYGRTIGTISAITFDYDDTGDIGGGGTWESPQVTSLPNLMRVDTITLSSALIAVDDGEIMYYGLVNNLVDHYIGKSFAIYPNYWKEPAHNPHSIGATAIQMKFIGTNSHLSGGSAHPTVEWAPNWHGRFGAHGRINIPIGGVFTSPDNGNPASTMALLVKEALELSGGTAIGRHSDPIHPDVAAAVAQSYPADAFSVLISGPTIAITQKYGSVRNIGVTGVRYAEPFGMYAISPNAAFKFIPLDEAIRFEILGINQNSMDVDGFQKSAGDKAQDLIGIISNATKDIDLIRGIQIPYDSLITSSAVTPMARNFFLTFGQQNLEAKGSIENTRNASLAMIPSTTAGDIGGSPSNESNETWLTRLVGGALGPTMGALAEFTGGLISDSMIALTSEAHGNDGGIRIVPEKLHVRYDAGHNYYAFNLKLLASDFVIGV